MYTVFLTILKIKSASGKMQPISWNARGALWIIIDKYRIARCLNAPIFNAGR